jgi:hypothetical protein
MGPLQLDMYLSSEVVKVRRNVKETLKILFQLCNSMSLGRFSRHTFCDAWK